MTLGCLARQLGLMEQIEEGLLRHLGEGRCACLLSRILDLPVRKSRALRSLGSYVSRGGRPQEIRLQFAQEPQSLRQTLLHEVAHLCDHLIHQEGRRYRRAHGPGWRLMVACLGCDASVRGSSDALGALRQQRLKLVAVCERCGAQFHRLRSFPKGRVYAHRGCGGRLLPR